MFVHSFTGLFPLYNRQIQKLLFLLLKHLNIGNFPKFKINVYKSIKKILDITLVEGLCKHINLVQTNKGKYI